MSFDVRIEIFGTIATPAVAADLALALTGFAIDGRMLSSEEFVNRLGGAAMTADCIVAERADIETMYVARLTQLLIGHGLSYAMTYGHHGCDDMSFGETYRPEMDGRASEFRIEDGIPLIAASDVKNAIALGGDAVAELVRHLEDRSFRRLRKDLRIDMAVAGAAREELRNRSASAVSYLPPG